MNGLDKTKKHLKYIFAAITALIIWASNIITKTIEYTLEFLGIIGIAALDRSWLWVGVVSVVVCAIIGGLLALLTNKFFFRHFNTMIDGLERLSSGKYDTRVDLGHTEGLRTAADSFNSLAEQLENTEILRTDFINNFSHEFKTPMVSIKGLISLLRSGRVPKEKEAEYLRIIEEEVDRLTMMTTNVLNLSKLENQSILPERCEYNLSEQIRTCVLLEERKWSERELELNLDFDEYTVYAAEDLLKQVWINLIDNAIKFTPRGGELKVSIFETEEHLTVDVTNSGRAIAPDELEKIWGKFYQVDRNHSKSGNGIGLSIVKSIVELHSGSVGVRSADGYNTFSITLPKR